MTLQSLESIGASGLQWSPYCGPGPTPAELAGRWNLDPWLLGVFAAGAAGCFLLRGRERARPGLLLAALALLAVAFVSPLCALSSALFSARVVHHGLLIVGAAPLLAFGLPVRPRRGALWSATLLHALALWAWHAPSAYALALTYDGAYWLMQATIGLSALAFWLAVRESRGLAAAAGLLGAMLQMGALGALISLAPRAIYAPHLATTQAWGLSPLSDQQLGGLIMWAPMAAAYLLAALVLVARALEPPRTGPAAA